jgi:cell division protein FtsB
MYTLKEQVRREKGIRIRVYLLLLFIIFVALLYSFFFGDMGYLKYSELKRNEKKLLTEINQISQINNTLKFEIELLQKDPLYLEKYAKEKFGLVKPGEIIFQFKNEDQ